ncbi:dipeptide epimerase [Salinirubellus salinus]|uniref:Dipeptide epimerase n=1 Tax=Salinirubellus salinus TaxID=1364945 RepID=A0A9E7R4A7_9EURY|nr:dipeptide epimerase [Salinirubellus salinus]UWM55595.1 dipeptide epimerase [Salinirubellus salinus]
MRLETDVERVRLETAEPFGISRGTTTGTQNVVVRIGDGEHVGLGAAAPSTRYGETAATVETVLPDLLAVVEDVADPHAIDAVHAGMDRVVRRNPAAKAAVDVALHDLAAKRVGLPLYRHLGLGTDGVTSSYTVSLADAETMADRARAATDAGYEVLKVKLGAGDGADRDRFDAVRAAAPGATVRVDANEAWTPKQAVRNAAWLADGDVEFLEQPVPASDPEGLRQVYEHAPLPVAVDESCEVASDVPQVADRADVVVVKLMKCGGVRPALEAIHAARAHGLEVMLGCMLETNAAIAAGAHLVPLLDYADLDGSLLLASDPYDGVPMPNGTLEPTTFDRPGTGARPATNGDG